LLVKNIASLDFIRVGSETEALLLESRLIKKFQPHFNLISKDDKSPYYITISKEKFPRPIITHTSSGSSAGPFLNSLIPRRILGQFRRVAPFCTAARPVKKPCFYSHIGLCNPCPGSIGDNQLAYKTNISRLKQLLRGRFEPVAAELKRSMSAAAEIRDFETAAKARDRLQALAQLRSHTISPDEYLQNPNLITDTQQQAVTSLKDTLVSAGLEIGQLHRIEMYDNAHLSGKFATSAMTVAIDGELLHSQYRHFRIKNAAAVSDTAMMKEVLTRRFSASDWPTPDLIVLDGGIPQLSAAKEIVLPCPVISLAKQNETIIIPRPDGEFFHLTPPRNFPALKLLQALRDEAHRFSRRLHHKLISKTLTSSKA